MPVIEVWIVRVLLAHRLMLVRVRFGHRPVVWVAVMLVVDMGMLMLEDVMGMLMVMPLREM